MRQAKIGNQWVGDSHPCFITFEAGPTHSGLKSAIELATRAAESGANAIKFQVFDPDRLIHDKEQLFSYKILVDKDSGEAREVSEPLYELFKRRALTKSEWVKLSEHCKHLGLAFFATVGFEDELDFMVELGCDSIKIASSDVNHIPLLRAAGRSGVNVQLDTGSSDIGEIKEAVEILESEGCQSIIIHQCPSGYPARLESIYLKMIGTLRSTFERWPIAYSDHTPDMDMDIAALALGANLIEKTITSDRCIPSVEHMFSLEFSEMRNFIDRLRDIEKAMGDTFRPLSDEQKLARQKLRRSPYVNQTVKQDSLLRDIPVTFKRPGYGIDPGEWERLSESGARVSRDIEAGTIITLDCISNEGMH